MQTQERGSTLRERYPLYIEIGFVLALALLIVAFRIDFSPDQSFTVQMEEQETVDMKQIQQTKQEEEPPPPPKPPVPQEVPDNQVIEQETPDFDASLDLDERLDTSSKPPAPETDEEEDENAEPEIFVAVEESPDCGGIEALRKQVEYPPFAKKAGIQGRVFVQFVVNEEGEVTRPTVTRGVHELLNKAAVNAVKRLDCTPGKQRGEPVKVQMSLPVLFKLKEK